MLRKFNDGRAARTSRRRTAESRKAPSPVMVAAPEREGDASLGKKTTSFINLLLMMKAFPALVFSMATVPIVFSIAALGGGVTLWRDVWAAIREGDPAALAAVMLGLVYALLCTMAVSSMKETIERRRKQKLDDERFEVIRKDQAEIRAAVATIESGQAEAEERSDYIASTMSALARRLRVENIMRPNTYECWTGLTPGSEFISVGGRCVLDLVADVAVTGAVRWIPDVERIEKSWLERFARGTAVGKAVFVVYVDPNAQGCPESIAKYLLLFRTLKQIAAVKRITLDLDRARFLLKESNESSPEVSFFLGRQKVDGIDTPFVNSYVDFESMYRVSFLDDVVYTSYNPRGVDAMHKAYRAIAATCSGQHTLDDLERAYGHLVEPVEVQSLASQAAEWGVENGDHFTI